MTIVRDCERLAWNTSMRKPQERTQRGRCFMGVTPSNRTIADEVAEAHERVASILRSACPQFARLKPDGSGSPLMLALRDAFHAFPTPTENLLVDAGGFSSWRDNAPYWTIVRYDLSQPNTNTIRFVREVRASELPLNRSLLSEHFGIDDDSVDDACALKVICSWDEDFFTLFAPFDIRKQADDYARELAERVARDSPFREMFVRETDFKGKYGLKADQVLSFADLTKIDGLSACFLRIDTSEPPPVESRQQGVASVQLIPQVPEAVCRALHWAKRLYVFGYFEYGFYTIALHYAYLALEAALHARWSATLTRPCMLRYRDKTKAVEQVTLDHPSRAAIRSYCKQRGWRVEQVLVNGERFPLTAGAVLASLRRNGIINDWQAEQFKELWLELRNYHSHLEFCPIETPAAGTLARAAYEINTLFDSLPVPPKAGTQHAKE